LQSVQCTQYVIINFPSKIRTIRILGGWIQELDLACSSTWFILQRTLTMLPASLLALTASFILPLIAAASTPVCIPSAEGYQLDTLDTLYQSFCSDLSKSGFSASQELYGVPVISLRFVPTPGVDKCDQANCLSTFGTLAQSCKSRVRHLSSIVMLNRL
jgi:hypothetical protein